MTPATEPQADAQRDADTRRKRIATLTARLALKGHLLEELPGGGFVAGRWGQTRPLPDLQAVEAFARQVGAA